MDRNTKALIKAAKNVLDYVGMETFLDCARGTEAFGIRAADLRKLRKAVHRTEETDSPSPIPQPEER